MSVLEIKKYRYDCDRCQDLEIMPEPKLPLNWTIAHEDSRIVHICAECSKSEPERINEALNKEADRHHLSEERITDIAAYELEHLHTSDRLSLNGRLLFSLIREVRLLRKLAETVSQTIERSGDVYPNILNPLQEDLEEWEKYK